VAWSELDKKNDAQPEKENATAELRALANAVRAAVSADKQKPFREFLLQRAHAVSFRPGVEASEVAFREGQRSLALQILKLAGEIK
jgi:hypothetical protein